jgi:2-dehydro-3-deoxyphosphogluconate aldolase / (4S)-4-hydroxy-2-oxoglutarate aldolase
MKAFHIGPNTFAEGTFPQSEQEMSMTPAQQSTAAAKICALAPVMPVLVIDDLAFAAPLARALVAGGLPALEVTLRTPCALDAIRAMSEIEGGVVGAGTLLTPKDVKAAKAAGARFGVSPGATQALIDACIEAELPLLPGAATATEIMLLLEMGFTVQKFFPAEQAGGAAYLKSIGSPLPQVSFCPTGGISLKIAPDYLALKNILCVGGSWVAPKDAMARGDWALIETLAREASQLPR